MTPAPPLLFIRPKLVFWTESEWNGTSSATLQAFREGCYERAQCLDATGRNWPIVAANLVAPVSLLDKLLPWRRLPVALTLGVPTPVVLRQVVEALCEILSHPESDFPFELAAPPATVQAKLRSAQSVPQLIAIAKECGNDAA